MKNKTGSILFNIANFQWKNVWMEELEYLLLQQQVATSVSEKKENRGKGKH